MRILLTAHPGWGHLHPMIALARATAAVGHDVRLATAASMVPALERLGVPAVAAGVDWEISAPEERIPGFTRARPLSQARAMAGLAGDGMIDDLLRLAGDWPPDVVVRDSYEVGGLIAGRRLGVPVAVIGVTVRVPPEITRRTTGRRIDALRRRYGIEAGDPDDAGDLWLSPMPPSFRPPEWPDLEIERHVRPLLFDRSGDEGLPPWVEQLERPLVYVTLGTVFNRFDGLFATVLDALAGEPVEVLATVGRTADPAAFGPLPANARVERYIPQSLLLDRVAAVVTHGGFNTVMAALSFGVPVACLPLSADHPVNAGRCVALGVGTACTTYAPAGGFPVARPEEVTPAAVAGAVRPLLEDPAYRAAARRMRDEIRALPGPEEAIRLIESLARGVPD